MMEYFMMQQDRRLTHLPIIRMQAGGSDREQRKGETAPLMLYVENYGLSCQYSDYLIRPFPMIGERIQRVMEKHQRDIGFRQVILMDKNKGSRHIYYRISVPEIDCASAAEPDGSRKDGGTEPVLELDKVKDAKIFRIKQMKEMLFVRLDAAEGILRREPEGIWFAPVKAVCSANRD